MEDNPEILIHVHIIERPITVHYEDSDKGTVFGEFFTYRPGIDILYYPEERDDKGELIKAGHYVLLRRAILWSQPENEKVYSLGDYVAFRSETNDWFICVISEINDPSKEVKVRFMRKSGQYFLLSEKLEKWFLKSAIFHRCSIPSIDNRMRYFFDVININPIQYGLFLKHYSMGGPLWPPPCNFEVEQQNLVGSGILMCFLQKWH